MATFSTVGTDQPVTANYNGNSLVGDTVSGSAATVVSFDGGQLIFSPSRNAVTRSGESISETGETADGTDATVGETVSGSTPTVRQFTSTELLIRSQFNLSNRDATRIAQPSISESTPSAMQGSIVDGVSPNIIDGQIPLGPEFYTFQGADRTGRREQETEVSEVSPTNLIGDDYSSVSPSMRLFTDTNLTITASILPASFFKDVTVFVEDQDGNPITNAELLVILGPLSTAATPSEKNKFVLNTLIEDYQDFRLLVPADNSDNTLVWIPSSDVTVPKSAREITVQFDSREIVAQGGGITIGRSNTIG